MSDYVAVDFETRSGMSIRKVGASQYIRHNSTEIMSCVWKKGEEVIVWCPALSPSKEKGLQKWRDEIDSKLGLQVCYTDEPPEQVKEWAKYPWLAHNCDAFDKPLWDAKLSTWFTPKQAAAYQPSKWIDTIHLARMADLPASLDKLLPRVMPDATKDSKSAMLYLTAGKVIGDGVVFVKGNMEMWYKLLKYNIIDVVFLEQLFEQLKLTLNGTYELQIESIETHRKINAHGILVDVKWLDNLIAHWNMLAQTSNKRATEVAGREINLRSTQQVISAISKMGLRLPDNSLNKGTVDKILENPEKFVDMEDARIALAIELLSLRQNVAKATIGKVNRIRSLVAGLPEHEARITDWAVYNKAHTGRYSSVGIQTHNFARGYGATGKMTEWPYDKLDSRNPEDCIDSDLLTELTRGALIPRPGYKFAVLDYAAIEARVCPWLVGCKLMLQNYYEGKDPYIVFAAKIYGIDEKDVTKEQRFVGKQGILACQYQVGPDKLDLMCEAFGVNLVDVGVTPKQVVDTFRSTYPEYVEFWKAINKACMDVVGGRAGNHSIFLGGPNGDAIEVYEHYEGLMIKLPSGRSIRYNSPKIVHKPAPWDGKTMIPGLTYAHPMFGDKSIYGGLLTENLVQGISKDAFQRGMDNTPSNCQVALHAHDEEVVEVPAKTAEASIKKIGKIMSEDIDWAPGLPIGVEAFITDRYCKEPLKGTKKYHFQRGKLL